MSKDVTLTPKTTFTKIGGIGAVEEQGQKANGGPAIKFAAPDTVKVTLSEQNSVGARNLNASSVIAARMGNPGSVSLERKGRVRQSKLKVVDLSGLNRMETISFGGAMKDIGPLLELYRGGLS